MKKVAFLLVAIVIGAWNLFPVSSADPVTQRPLQRVTVAPGDTLWRIAARNADDGEDLRSAVSTICKINQLDEAACLTPGQQLLTPAPKDKE